MDKFKTIDSYIHSFSKNIQEDLQVVRQIISEEAPNAVESINYGMPTFKLNGHNLVHFAGWKTHIAVYPATGALSIVGEFGKYRTGKGTFSFPLSKPLPIDFIRK